MQRSHASRTVELKVSGGDTDAAGRHTAHHNSFQDCCGSLKFHSGLQQTVSQASDSCSLEIVRHIVKTKIVKFETSVIARSVISLFVSHFKQIETLVGHVQHTVLTRVK